MLLDTSGLLCLHYQTEPFHSQAVRAYREASTLITHSYIIAEYIALVTARRLDRSSAIDFVISLLDNPDKETIWIDESLHRDAIALLVVSQHKNYSLCAAVSFVLMRNIGIMDALTTDKHFEQEGFLRLLKA